MELVNILTGAQASTDCSSVAEIDGAGAEPVISSEGNSLSFEVDTDKDAVFKRSRRQTVSVFDLLDTVTAAKDFMQTELSKAQSEFKAVADAQTSTIATMSAAQVDSLASKYTSVVKELATESTKVATLTTTLDKALQEIADLQSTLKTACAGSEYYDKGDAHCKPLTTCKDTEYQAR